MKKHNSKDLLEALRVIAMLPQAYHDRGPEFVVAEMKRTADLAIAGEFENVGEADHMQDPFGYAKPRPIGAPIR